MLYKTNEAIEQLAKLELKPNHHRAANNNCVMKSKCITPTANRKPLLGASALFGMQKQTE